MQGSLYLRFPLSFEVPSQNSALRTFKHLYGWLADTLLHPCAPSYPCTAAPMRPSHPCAPSHPCVAAPMCCCTHGHCRTHAPLHSCTPSYPCAAAPMHCCTHALHPKLCLARSEFNPLINLIMLCLYFFCQCDYLPTRRCVTQSYSLSGAVSPRGHWDVSAQACHGNSH